jgi:hypothetical protein
MRTCAASVIGVHWLTCQHRIRRVSTLWRRAKNSMISQAGRTCVAETPYFVGFRAFRSPSDGKIQRQNAEKNFTVRFTVKTIRWEAMDAIDAER